MAGEVGAVAAEVGELLAVLVVKSRRCIRCLPRRRRRHASFSDALAPLIQATAYRRKKWRCSGPICCGLSDSLEAQIAAMNIRLLLAGGAVSLSPTRHRRQLSAAARVAQVSGLEVQLLTNRALENQHPAGFGHTLYCGHERHWDLTLAAVGTDRRFGK
jgi:hypothetical protein